MIKGIVVFLMLWIVIVFAINLFRIMTATEKIDSIKLVMYSGFTAAITMGILSGIVILF